MTDANTMVEQLLSEADNMQFNEDLDSMDDGISLMREAAALIRSMAAENERLTPLAVAYDYLESPVRADAAEAEIAVLREALESARSEFKVEVHGGKIGGISHAGDALPRVINLLDTALARAAGRREG